jgi:AcrR family transcriptional regulator
MTTTRRKAQVVEAAEQRPDPRARSLEPRRSDSRRNKDRVLEAAIRVLSEHPNATVEDVAAEAGLNRSTVYRRFSGREQLLDAVRWRLVEESRALFRETVAQEPDFGRCMDVMFQASVRLAYRRRLIWQRLIEIGALPRLEDYQPKDTFVAWLEAGQRDGELRDDLPVEWLVTLWMHLVNAGSNAADRCGIDIEDAARLAVDAAVRALRPR